MESQAATVHSDSTCHTPLDTSLKMATFFDGNLSSEAIKQAVNALYQFFDVNTKNSKKTKKLLDENEKIMLILIYKKIPTTNPKQIRDLQISVPHPVFTESKSVCLFVKDLNYKKRNVDDDQAVHHFKDILESKGINGINEIITLHQLKAEFKPYEAKRNLCNSHDLFLADSRIVSFLPRLIGKEFYKRKRLPVKVDMEAKNLRQKFQAILKSTHFYVNGHGSTSSIHVASRTFLQEQVIENLSEVIMKLPDIIPGGWKNIRLLQLKTLSSIPIPIYKSTGSANDIRLEKPKRTPDDTEPEELYTSLNTKVKILPNGYVRVYKDEQKPDGEEEESDEETDFRDIVSEKSRRKTFRPIKRKRNV